MAETDVAIIGAGPIGIELAAGLKQAGLSLQHVEAGPIGSTFLWWAPQTRFFSSPERIAIAGVPLTSVDQTKATREQYLAYLRGVVTEFGLDIRTYSRVTRIRREPEAFALEIEPSAHGVGGPQELARDRSDGPAAPRRDVMRARNVALAIGDMHRPRLLGIPGESMPHVSHYLAEPHVYFGRRVLIVGGKNSAVEAALRLYRVGAEVTISYRGREFDPKRVKYWLRPELEWLIGKGRIGYHPETVITAIHEGTVDLAGDDGRTRTLEADFVLLMTGYEQDPDLFEQLGVELAGEDRVPVFDKATMQTNVPGVYVAGTAAAGSQHRTRLFIENAHVHVARIVRAISGRDVPWVVDEQYARLEEA